MKNQSLRRWTYLGALFMAVYSSLPAYINSSFLKKFVSEEGIGKLYIVSSIITIILMLLLPSFIRRFGNKFTLIGLVSFSILVTIPLAYPQKVIHTLTVFVVYIILGYLTRYALDVYLENVSDNRGTGLIRGLYLTFYNFAWLVSPFLAAYLVNTGNYTLVYVLAGVMLIPLLLISIFGLTEFKGSTKTYSSVWVTFKNLWSNKLANNKNIRQILAIDFLLNFFYAVMVVYMPIYLRDHIGLSWGDIGLTFTIMLLPFVLFELPLGKIADKWWGEKELLLGGLTIISLATIACAYLNSTNWVLWAILLFFTRVGASTIEIMKETYLFKKISGADTGIISISRINVPLSYLIGSTMVSSLLVFFDLRLIFLVLGLIMLTGLKFAWTLKDTK